jgi:hypothetical protein
MKPLTSPEEIAKQSREIAASITLTQSKPVERQLEEAERTIKLLIAGGFVSAEKVRQARELAADLK